MKKRGKFIIQINLSNRWLYTFIILGILAIIGVGVYALAPGVAPNPGHLLSEVGVPTGCVAGQFISWNGTNLICSSDNDYCSGGKCNGNLNVNGEMKIVKHIIMNKTTSPTLSCGSGANMTGSDSAGKVNSKSSSGTPCTVTFSQPFDSTPVCIMNILPSSTASYDFFITDISKTSFTVKGNANNMNFNYVCVGIQ